MVENNGTRAVAAALVSFCVVISVLNLLPTIVGPDSSNHLRRFLQEEDRPGQHPPAIPSAEGGIYSWARNHIRTLEAVPHPGREVVVFWHLPKSGGTTLESIYQCMGKTIANRAGVDPLYGHQDQQEIVSFQPWPGISRASYVNVDTSNRAGINRAKRLGLVPSGLVDLIITSDPTYAVETLFDETHKGRVLALFRHPIDRLVSSFYYLREAKWEHQYRPQWQDITILEWAKKKNFENNYMIKKLSGLGPNDEVTEEHLHATMRTIQKRFIVGLMDEMEESVHRFNIVMGIDESDENNQGCMDHFFHHSVGAKRHSSDSHPKVETGSATWNALAKRNALDISLYDFILQLFQEQQGLIESYSHNKKSSFNGEES